MTAPRRTYSPATNTLAAEAVLRKAVTEALRDPHAAMRTLYAAVQSADLLLDRAVVGEVRVYRVGSGWAS